MRSSPSQFSIIAFIESASVNLKWLPLGYPGAAFKFTDAESIIYAYKISVFVAAVAFSYDFEVIDISKQGRYAD